MKIKIGDNWYECRPEQPIMVELTETDKRNIANMHPDATRYAIFDDYDNTSTDDKLAWMEKGCSV